MSAHRFDLETAIGTSSPVLSYPAEVNHTTNAIDSLHMQLRKIIKTAAIFVTTTLP